MIDNRFVRYLIAIKTGCSRCSTHVTFSNKALSIVRRVKLIDIKLLDVTNIKWLLQTPSFSAHFIKSEKIGSPNLFFVKNYNWSDIENTMLDAYSIFCLSLALRVYQRIWLSRGRKNLFDVFITVIAIL